MTEPQLTEEEIRQLEAEMERITVDDVLLQTIVSLVNLGARKAGLAGGQPDLEQAQQAIDGVRALLPVVEPRHADKLGPIKDALSQLQMAYARQGGSDPSSGGAKPPAGEGGEPGPGGTPSPGPQHPGPGGGRLWVPGQ
ncbi:MAG: hypothetical protein ACLGI3_15720 [Actinomycetes bacterium]